MNRDLSKYRLVVLIILFVICIVNVILLTVNPENIVIKDSQFLRKMPLSNYDQNLELKADDSVSTSAGLKVEIVAISIPVTFDSGDFHLSNLNHQFKIYTKKRCSLISHNNLIISIALNISPLITRLQI